MAVPNEEAGIDISRHVRYLLRHWLIVVFVTLFSGALGWAIARVQTPIYLGTARLIVMQAGSRLAADAVVQYQAALREDSVLAAAIVKEGSAHPINPDALRAALSSRLAYPPREFLVEVRWPEAGLATRLARSIAYGALEAVRLKHVDQLRKTRELLRVEHDAADQWVLKARADLDQFRAANAQVLAAMLPSDQRAELAYLDGEVPKERKRLATTEAELEKSTESTAARNDLLRRASEVRTRLMALEANRNQLAARVSMMTPSNPSDRAQQATVKQREDELIAELSRAESEKDVISGSAVNQTNDNVALIDLLQLVNEPVEPGRLLTSRTAGVARGLATGLVLSIFGVLFYRGFWFR